METIILAFQAYQAGGADTAVWDLIRETNLQYADFKTQLKSVNEGHRSAFRNNTAYSGWLEALKTDDGKDGNDSCAHLHCKYEHGLATIF